MRIPVLAAMVALVACGPIDQGGSGAGSGSGPADAGASGPGGSADAGGGGGGGGGVALDCTGVMPPDPGPATMTVNVPHGKGEVCFNATADLSGNVAAESHASSMGDAWTGRWQIWSPSGEARGSFSGVGGDVYGQKEGFQSTQGNSLVAWSASGQEARRSRLDDSCSHEAFFSAGGGSLVLDRCGSRVKAERFDAQGEQAASAEIGDGAAAAGIVDAQGRVLIMVATGGSYTARWYDASLRPTSDSFAIGGSGSATPAVRPLVGGGAAVQVNGSWIAAVRSGVAAADDPPAWLAGHPHFDLQTIRKDTAYALIPKSGASPRNKLELFSGAGGQCGAVTFPTEGLSMGPEGIVIGSSGEGGCTHGVWSGLLR